MAIGSTLNTSAMTFTFDDEFNTFSASSDGSTGLWRTTLANGSRTLASNGEQEYYSDSSVGVNPFSLQNGVLDITATPAAPGSNALNLPYNSGVITTQNSFNQLYGYFEIDAKMPAGQGLWPAFWMVPASGAWPPELDTFEVLGNAPTTLYFSTHSSVQATQGTTLSVANVSSGFNKYGVMWGPQTVDLYINDVEVASMATPADMNVPMYMLANLAVGGYWPGSPNSSTVFPATMQINYVHAYAYPGTTGGTVYDTLPSQNVGAAAVAPVISAPTGFQAATGVATLISGVSVAANWPGGFFTVMVSDAKGLLQTAATTDVFASGEGTTFLTLTGNLPAINASLATLSYQGTATGNDWIWVGATDPQGQQGTASIVATDVAGTTPSATAPVAGLPVVTAPATMTLPAGTAQALAGIALADSQSGGTFTVKMSDTTGILHTASVSGVTEAGEGSAALTLTGSLAAVDAELASLTYRAGSATGSDWLWVSANDASGNQGLGHTMVTATPPVAAPPTVTPPTVISPSVPVVTAPAGVTLAAGTTQALTGVTVADSQAGGAFTVTVSDSFGLLNTTPVSGVAAQGQGSTSLKLAGSLAAIGADLASLTYRAGSATGSDWLWVSAADANGNQGIGHSVVTITPQIVAPPPLVPAIPVVTAPAAMTLAAGTTQALAGISVMDGQTGGTFTIKVSDSTGILHTTSVSGVTEAGEGSTAVTLTGSLAAVNAELASLTDQAGSAAGSDWLWVSANDASGNQGIGHTVVTATPPVAAPVPVAPSVPVVTAPAAMTLDAGTTQALAGVTVADAQAGGVFTVTISDSSGLLNATAVSGVTAQGQGSTSLTLTGSLAAIDAELASLTYLAGSATGSDWLWVSANDALGNQGLTHTVVTVASPPVALPPAAPVVTAPAATTLAAGTTQALTGVSVASTMAGGNVSVSVSDTAGLLRTTSVSGVTEQGEGTTALTLTGGLAAVNAELANLTYRAGSAAGTDWLWVSAYDSSGNQGMSHDVVSVLPAAAVVNGLLTGPQTTLLTGLSLVGAALQVDGGHTVKNTGTLTWNGGTIALGSGDPTATNHTGTLDNAAGALFAIQGNATLTGSGTSAFINDGTVDVSAGTLTLQPAVTDNGTFLLHGSGVLNFAGVVGGGGTIEFLSPAATLEVQAPGAFGPTILGFAQGDTIDVAPVPFGLATMLTFVQAGSGGTLTVSDGTQSSAFNLTGSYNTAGFHMASDNHGGTAVTFS